MRIPSKFWRWLVIGLVVVAITAWVVGTWAVPALIVRQIQARYGGKVTIRHWWFNGRSAGVVGLALHEGPAADSAIWASAERVATDISLGGLLRGRFAPRLVTLDAPRIRLQFDRNDQLLTQIPLKSKHGKAHGRRSTPALPIVIARQARVTIRQQGRPEMVVSGIDARLAPESGGARLSAQTDDPTWGHWEAAARFDSKFRTGDIQLLGTNAPAKLDTVVRIPFVSETVWENLIPRGPVDVRLTSQFVRDRADPFTVETVVELRRTTLTLPTLELTAVDTTGEVVVKDHLVRLNRVTGRVIGGRGETSGTLDFRPADPRFNLTLKLDRVNVADTPKAWELRELGVTGRLTGKAHLLVLLAPHGVDLSGSSGEAVIRGASWEGIPIKSLHLVMRAWGNTLQYDTDQAAAAWPRRAGRSVVASERAITSRRTDWAAARLVALQAPAGPQPGTEAGPRGFVLPRSITTAIELQDVDLTQVLARGEALGIHIPMEIAGRLSLKVTATIPLRNLRSIRDYVFHGDATLMGASIGGMAIGRLTARLDLVQGVLALSDFRGRLVDVPSGGIHHPPRPTPPVPVHGPLPPGGFRGGLRAELSPLGGLSARFEANQLPLRELAAPLLPRSTPLSGLVSLTIEAQSRVAAIADPREWTVSGRARSVQITYLGSTLDAISARFSLRDGQFEIPDLTARLAAKPLAARLGVDLVAPHRFAANLDVSDWSLADLASFVPGMPHPAPVSGFLTARASARGTLTPRSIQTRGRGHLAQFRAGAVPLGDVPFRWTTEHDVIVISGVEARPFGGRMSAEARVPIQAGQPTRGTATLTGIDTAQLASLVPGAGLRLTGHADGRVEFVIPAETRPGAAAIQATVHLSAPDLTIQGLPAEKVHASIGVHRGVLTYEVRANSLGGTVRFRGDVPLGALGGARADARADANLQVVGLTLGNLWNTLGVTGPVAEIEGWGWINVNLRIPLNTATLWARGVGTIRDLRWGPNYPLGWLRFSMARTPTAWWIDPLSGELLGGLAGGTVSGRTPAEGPPIIGFGLRIDRLALARAVAAAPSLARNLQGSATVRLTGQLDGDVHAGGEVRAAQVRAFGLSLADLRGAAELAFNPSTRMGTLQARQWSVRLAGGQARGDAQFRIGGNQAFQGEVQLSGIRLSPLMRETEASSFASGRITGRISFAGLDPVQVRQLRGRVSLELFDAALFTLPVFRDINRFLGSARGGTFDRGHLDATLTDRAMVVDQLALQGRLVQLHANGTVGYSSQLDLDVLISTRQFIPQTGLPLLALIPGLGEFALIPGASKALLGRNVALLRVGNFLSSRLLKLHVTGTISAPTITIDPNILVTSTAAAFFASALKLPIPLGP